jgi:hypothetical protein
VEPLGKDSFRGQSGACWHAAVFDRLYNEAANGIFAGQFAGVESFHVNWLTNFLSIVNVV